MSTSQVTGSPRATPTISHDAASAASRPPKRSVTSSAVAAIDRGVDAFGYAASVAGRGVFAVGSAMARRPLELCIGGIALCAGAAAAGSVSPPALDVAANIACGSLILNWLTGSRLAEPMALAGAMLRSAGIDSELARAHRTHDTALATKALGDDRRLGQEYAVLLRHL